MANTEHLFASFCEYLDEAVKNKGYPIANEDGSTTYAALDASFLAVVRAFLKDYPPGVEVGGESTLINTLSQYGNLPFSPKADRKKSNAATTQHR